MGLVGNLEDLGLGDILQIVSLSKKSGVLLLSSGQHEGLIAFTDGLVVQAFSSQLKSSLGSLLLRYKILDQRSLDQALVDKKSLPGCTLTSFFIDRFKLSPDKIDAIIKAQVERIVYSFFGWREGSFDFRVDELLAQCTSLADSQGLVLERGLNPQWLAVEGRRLLAEGRLISAEKDDALAAAHLPVDGPLTQDSLPFDLSGVSPLFIIDDDAPTRSVLKKAFIRAGFEVEVFALTSDLIKACHDKMRIGQRPALLIDLIMPRLDGRGILGGLEVMEIIADKFTNLPMLLMTDHINAEAEKKAQELGGIAVLRKPKKIEIREERGVDALKNLLIEVDRYLLPSGERAARHSDAYDIGKDLMDEFDLPEPKSTHLTEGSPGLYLLKGMLQELVNPLLSGGVILLILRFASELFNRAVIFDVDGMNLVGIGQFGLDATTGNPDQMVRDLRLQVDADSLFGRVMRQKIALKGMLGQGGSDHKLRHHLGGDSSEVFVGPLVSEGKVIAMLYGDNLPESKPVGNVEAFEIFLSQAGMAMEKVLLERGINVSI
ncbi:MAG: response regulator [Geopsychrobacter sp.]|nr:response regulator [Geopsychrobacter sp.]